MKTIIRAVAFLLATLTASAQPTIPIRVDLQAPQREFKTRWAAGSTPTLEAQVFNGGTPYNLATGGWTGLVYVAVTPTAGVFVSSDTISSNRMRFPFAASQSATVGTFSAYIIIGNGTNTYEWGKGSFTWTDSPALLGAGPIDLLVPFNWDLYSFTGTPPAFQTYFTNPLSGEVTGYPTNTLIAADVIGTNKLDAEVRGMLVGPDRVGTNDLTPGVRSMLYSALAWSTYTVYRAAAFTGPYPGYGVYSATSNDLVAIAAYEQNLGYGNYWRYGLLDLWTLTTGISNYHVRLTAMDSMTGSGLGIYRNGGAASIVWDSGNDGLDSGLDADLLDGLHATNFARGVYLESGTFKITNAMMFSGNISGQFDITNTPFIISAGSGEYKGGPTSTIRRLILLGGSDISGWRGFVEINTTNSMGVILNGLSVIITNGQYHGNGALISNVNASALRGYLPTDFASSTGIPATILIGQISLSNLSAVVPNVEYVPFKQNTQTRLAALESASESTNTTVSLPFRCVGLNSTSVTVGTGTVYVWADATNAQRYVSCHIGISTQVLATTNAAIFVRTDLLFDYVYGGVSGIVASLNVATGMTPAGAIADAFAAASPTSLIRLISVVTSDAGTNAAAVDQRWAGDIYYDRY